MNSQVGRNPVNRILDQVQRSRTFLSGIDHLEMEEVGQFILIRAWNVRTGVDLVIEIQLAVTHGEHQSPSYPQVTWQWHQPNQNWAPPLTKSQLIKTAP